MTLPPNDELTLRDMQAFIHAEAVKRGWDTRSDSERIMMMVEEVGEVAKEIRRHQGNLGYAKPENTDALGAELVDVCNYLIDLANSNGIDLTTAFKAKWAELEHREWQQ